MRTTLLWFAGFVGFSLTLWSGCLGLPNTARAKPSAPACAGIDPGDARRLRALEDENQRLNRLIAKQALDNQTLKRLLGKD